MCSSSPIKSLRYLYFRAFTDRVGTGQQSKTYRSAGVTGQNFILTESTVQQSQEIKTLWRGTITGEMHGANEKTNKFERIYYRALAGVPDRFVGPLESQQRCQQARSTYSLTTCRCRQVTFLGDTDEHPLNSPHQPPKR